MITVVYILSSMIVIVIILTFLHAWSKRPSMAASTNTASKKGTSMPYTNCRYTTILTSIFIGLTTSLSFAFFSLIRTKIEKERKIFRVNWQVKDTIFLKSGPEWFYYDQQKATLNALKSITEKDKTTLTSLLNNDDKNYPSYSQAIDQLAYLSNADSDSVYCWLLLLYCMTGVVGVQLRTINNFVGNACFKKAFDFSIWWPWYLLRPLLGFITGGVVFLLIDGKLFYTSASSSSLSPLVVALAFLGGFSADDFFGMLRKISQRAFNVGDKKDS